MAQQALYYPTWGIPDPRFLFDSLLYWERLACIVPEPEFRPRAPRNDHLDRPVDALHERFVSGITASKGSKKAGSQAGSGAS
jgi:hypothetical protein